MQEVKNRAKLYKRKNLTLFIIGVVVLLIVGGITMKLIYDRVDRLNRNMQEYIADERALAIQKEFDLLEQRLDIVLQYTVSGSTDEMLRSVHADTLLRRLLVKRQTASNNHTDSQKLYPFRDIAIGGHVLSLDLDLSELNRYFGDSKYLSRAYFEVYSNEGLCLVHPDTSKVGKMVRNWKKWMVDNQHTIVLSDYIGIDVWRNIYTLNNFLTDTKIVVSIPLILTEKEVREVVNLSMLLGLGLLIIALAFLLIIYRNRQKLQQFELSQLEMSREQAIMRFERLREQTNPHFLFNTLGSLQQLIGKDQQKAKTFVTQMVKVYRKILRDDHSGWNTVEDELSLVKAYLFLQEVRFGDALPSLFVDIPSDFLQRKIPRLSLQILIENAIKHNEFTDEEPLYLSIHTENETLVVRSGYKPRRVPEQEKGGYGLQFIASLYRFADIPGFKYVVDQAFFVVFLPLS